MSAHEMLYIHSLILTGNIKMLLALYKSLRASGQNDAARYLMRAAHKANKTSML